MSNTTVTKYMVCTTDYEIIVKKGFDTWTDAYHWSLNHDFGQFEEHGGLRAAAYTA